MDPRERDYSCPKKKCKPVNSKVILWTDKKKMVMINHYIDPQETFNVQQKFKKKHRGKTKIC